VSSNTSTIASRYSASEPISLAIRWPYVIADAMLGCSIPLLSGHRNLVARISKKYRLLVMFLLSASARNVFALQCVG
jgi:hypothetical protein